MTDAPERIVVAYYDDAEQSIRWEDGPEWMGETAYVRADLYAALEAERDELEAYLMDTLDQLDTCKLGYIDCLKSRSFELRRLEAERDELRASEAHETVVNLTGNPGARFIVAEGTPEDGLHILVNACYGREGTASYLWRGKLDTPLFYRERDGSGQTVERYIHRDLEGGDDE
jgi:hypothetical protein